MHLVNFLHYVIIRLEAKLPRKIRAFLKKLNGLLFFRFDDCDVDPLKGGPGQWRI